MADELSFAAPFDPIRILEMGEEFAKKHVEAVISSFCQWVQQKGYPLSTRRKLPGVLRNAIYNELPKRDESYEIIIRDMAGLEGLNLTFLRKTIWAYPELGLNWRRKSQNQKLKAITSENLVNCFVKKCKLKKKSSMYVKGTGISTLSCQKESGDGSLTLEEIADIIRKKKRVR